MTNVKTLTNKEVQKAVEYAMDMVIGDYLAVLQESNNDLPEEEKVNMELITTGLREVCRRFGIDYKALDVDNLIEEEATKE